MTIFSSKKQTFFVKFYMGHSNLEQERRALWIVSARWTRPCLPAPYADIFFTWPSFLLPFSASLELLKTSTRAGVFSSKKEVRLIPFLCQFLTSKKAKFEPFLITRKRGPVFFWQRPVKVTVLRTKQARRKRGSWEPYGERSRSRFELRNWQNGKLNSKCSESLGKIVVFGNWVV
jgi:hypothetical protein